jgi:hypothetical protein
MGWSQCRLGRFAPKQKSGSRAAAFKVLPKKEYYSCAAAQSRGRSGKSGGVSDCRLDQSFPSGGGIVPWTILPFAQDRANIQVIPRVASAWKVDKTWLRGGVGVVVGDVHQAEIVFAQLDVKGQLIGESLGWFFRVAMRIVEELAEPDVAEVQDLVVGDLERGGEIRAGDDDFDGSGFCGRTTRRGKQC